MKRFMGTPGSYIWSQVKKEIIGQFDRKGHFETEDALVAKELQAKKYNYEEVTKVVVNDVPKTVEEEVIDTVEDLDDDEDDDDDDLPFDKVYSEIELHEMKFPDLKDLATSLGNDFKVGQSKAYLVAWILENQEK